MCPVAFGLLQAQPPSNKMICHVLVIETDDGLVLVDTGFGRGDLDDPSRLGGMFTTFVKPALDPAETALAQIQKLGFAAKDVRHIIPTHLDVDHAGGLSDFPDAKVHVYAPELDAARARSTLLEKTRYRVKQWAHGPKWTTYAVQGEPWFGFECVRQLEGLPPDILLVPTIGHTRGHVAVALDDGKGTLVHAGDAYFHRREMDPERPRCPFALHLFQTTMAFDDVARVRNRERLRMVARDESVRIFCAHDPVEGDLYGIAL